ncbi:MAG: hypothetical protein JXR07_20270 [Reichenbachiella sp.]
MTTSITLSEDQFEELESMAALGYSLPKMAMYFDVDKKSFLQKAHDVESPIYYHIQRGQLMSEAKEQLVILSDAQKGDVPASKQLSEIRRARNWKISKLDIFGGMDHKKSIEILEDYLQSGSLNQLSSEEAIYIEALTLFNSLYRKFGRRNTVNFFTKKPFNLTYSRASEMFDEALNLFYIDRNVEKRALRNLKAEQIEEAAIVVRDNAQTSRDWEVYGNLQMQAAKLRELDKPDPEVLSKETYQKPVRIYSLDPQSVGIPKIERQEVANQIEALEIPERDKIRLKQDAMLELIQIEEKFHELQEESQDQ